MNELLQYIFRRVALTLEYGFPKGCRTNPGTEMEPYEEFLKTKQAEIPAVFYCGFRESKGIWGTWEILSDIRGGFHIWPRAHSEGEEEASSAEVSVSAFEVYAPA